MKCSVLGVLRRNWIPILGLAVAVAFVGWLGWINVRGGGDGGVGSATPSATASASGAGSPSATPDPAEAQVKAAAIAWVRAYFDTYKTGTADEVGALEVPDSQAHGDAGIPIHEITQTHKTFIAQTYDCPGPTITVLGTASSADLHCTIGGVDATWPGLKTIGNRTVSVHFALELELLGGRWLVSTQR